MKNNKSSTDSEAGLNDPKWFRKGIAEFFHEIQGLDLKQWMNWESLSTLNSLEPLLSKAYG